MKIHLNDDSMSPSIYYFLRGEVDQRVDLQYKELIDLGDGLVLKVILCGNHLFVGAENCFPWYTSLTDTPYEGGPMLRAVVRGKAKTKVITQVYRWRTSEDRRYGHRLFQESVTQEDCYIPSLQTGSDIYNIHNNYQHDPNDPTRQPYLFLTLDLILPNGDVHEAEVRFRNPCIGKVTIREQCGVSKLDVEVNCHGFNCTFTEDFLVPKGNDGNYVHIRDSISPVAILVRHLKGSTIVGGKDALWAAFLAQWHNDSQVPMGGIASLYKRKDIIPTFTRLQTENPLDWIFFRWLHDDTTMYGKRNNQLLAAMLREVGTDYGRLLAGLRAAREAIVDIPLHWSEYGHTNDPPCYQMRRALCEKLPGAAEKVWELEAKRDFRKAEGFAAQADGLGVTADKYPLLRKALEAGSIPIGVFNQPGKDGQPVNREFTLWERALAQKGWASVIYEIAQNAAGRSTYERDITPYLSFLFQLPKYLDRHTEGRKRWSAMPRFVQSQWELEMDDDANENGTQKRRSAFTPVADNETRVVEVPYVAVAVSGVRTQWCYSRHFHIFEEGFTDPESGGVVVNDFEAKLNGRDDYGLCYYTLTGTMTARGYPTFLIIFERRSSGTFVHFHRVRPCRSKNGVQTPACELVEACYQYMAGNIPAKDIEAQQGDLIFIRHPNDPIAAKAKVEEPQTSSGLVFESHALRSLNPDSELSLYLSTAKTPQNRLGFVWAPNGLKVEHPEHDNIEKLSEGWYEIRRCKSWEANPKAIWSLTLD